MIFLDTCIWIELLGVRSPNKPHEIKQAMAASNLLEKILDQDEDIITCKEQQIELINAIEKMTMKSISRMRKDNNMPGIGNLKDFRKLQEFQVTKELCESVIEDLQYFAAVTDIGDYDIESILERLNLADINDCLYYDYCTKENINFYTFDSDIKLLGDTDFIHRYDASLDRWC